MNTESNQTIAPKPSEEQRIAVAYQRRAAQGNTGRYSYFEPSNRMRIEELDRAVLRSLAHFGDRRLRTAAIAEIGCGTGSWLRKFVQFGAEPENLVGIDLLPERVHEARRLCPAAVRVECGNAERLPWPDESFDIVAQFVVFSSILDACAKRRIALEMMRVLRPGGMVLWYDFHVNNPSNPDVRGVTRAEIRELFAGHSIALRRITLAPPIARRVAPWSPALCTLLSNIALLRTHYFGVIRKRNGKTAV